METRQLFRITRMNEQRPISPEELDAFDEIKRESIGVSIPVRAGQRLEKGCLITVKTDTKGISPILLNRVAGCHLRYSIKPGEPLTFGHLYKGILNSGNNE